MPKKDTKFKKGMVNNPKGRPKGITKHIRALSNDYKDYFTLLDAFVRDPKNSVRERRECIKELLDRSLGKSTQTIESNSDLNIKIIPPKAK